MRDGSTNIALEEQCTINALFMGVSVETMTWVQDWRHKRSIDDEVVEARIFNCECNSGGCRPYLVKTINAISLVWKQNRWHAVPLTAPLSASAINLWGSCQYCQWLFGRYTVSQWSTSSLNLLVSLQTVTLTYIDIFLYLFPQSIFRSNSCFNFIILSFWSPSLYLKFIHKILLRALTGLNKKHKCYRDFNKSSHMNA
jgi:hypothetical protein